MFWCIPDSQRKWRLQLFSRIFTWFCQKNHNHLLCMWFGGMKSWYLRVFLIRTWTTILWRIIVLCLQLTEKRKVAIFCHGFSSNFEKQKCNHLLHAWVGGTKAWYLRVLLLIAWKTMLWGVMFSCLRLTEKRKVANFFQEFHRILKKKQPSPAHVSLKCKSMMPQSIIVHMRNNNTLRHHSFMPWTHREKECCVLFSRVFIEFWKTNATICHTHDSEAQNHDTSENHCSCAK